MGTNGGWADGDAEGYRDSGVEAQDFVGDSVEEREGLEDVG